MDSSREILAQVTSRLCSRLIELRSIHRTVLHLDLSFGSREDASERFLVASFGVPEVAPRIRRSEGFQRGTRLSSSPPPVTTHIHHCSFTTRYISRRRPGNNVSFRVIKPEKWGRRRRRDPPAPPPHGLIEFGRDARPTGPPDKFSKRYFRPELRVPAVNWECISSEPRLLLPGRTELSRIALGPTSSEADAALTKKIYR